MKDFLGIEQVKALEILDSICVGALEIENEESTKKNSSKLVIILLNYYINI